MTVFATLLNNAILDAVETSIGTGPIIRFREGTAPATPADASTGDLLLEVTAPSDWMAPASGSVKQKAGTWSGTISADGTAGYAEVLKSDGVTVQYRVPVYDDIGDVTSGESYILVPNLTFVTGTVVTFSAYTMYAGNVA